MATTQSGRCLCGDVNFTASGDPARVAYWHCASCRRRCGSPIAYETDRHCGEIDIYLNAFDNPAVLKPESLAFYSERIPWFDTRDDPPRKP